MKEDIYNIEIDGGYIRQGDCLALMKTLPDQSIDMIFSDLPYGMTACKWDKVIPPDKLWAEYCRIIKKHGAIVLFGKEPFSSLLIQSHLRGFKHKWVWDKKLSGSFCPPNICRCKSQRIYLYLQAMVKRSIIIRLCEKARCANAAERK